MPTERILTLYGKNYKPQDQSPPSPQMDSGLTRTVHLRPQPERNRPDWPRSFKPPLSPEKGTRASDPQTSAPSPRDPGSHTPPCSPRRGRRGRPTQEVCPAPGPCSQPAGTCPPPPTGEKQPRPHGFRCSHGSKRAPVLPGAPARSPPAQSPAQPRWPRLQPAAKRRARPVPPGLPGAPRQAALTPGRRPLTLAAFAPKASRDEQVTDSTTICQRGLIEETGPARQISDLCKVSRSAFRAGGCPSSLASSGEQTHSPHLYPSPSSSSPSSWEGPPANSITPRGRAGIPAHKLRASSAVFQEATYKSLWLTERETPHSLLLCLSPSHALSPCKAQGY
ncbi:vegetative cell wall protein gp1-like [Piliocolobus tephrosceles]|uniref:vegetative cell wall protein gp1-like n=1 Tax=Piliocolobus tephrosceles TaxID=591936 RepID=UPI001300FDDD|nr:vegetative cell wall protein gp1-like [Piliocolobus tephrosceles]